MEERRDDRREAGTPSNVIALPLGRRPRSSTWRSAPPELALLEDLAGQLDRIAPAPATDFIERLEQRLIEECTQLRSELNPD